MPISNVELGKGVIIGHEALVNLYGCAIGDETTIGPFVEVQKNSRIGARCKISSCNFICYDVTPEDKVFIAPGGMFTNDRYPQATADGGRLQTEADWTVVPTV